MRKSSCIFAKLKYTIIQGLFPVHFVLIFLIAYRGIYIMDFLFGKNRNNDGIKIESGLEFDGFRLMRKVGTGGMGEVWLAKQISMEREIAIKLLSPQFSMDSSFIDRFMQEVRTTARLFHPNIVQAYHAGNFHGLYYLAVAYVDGVNLGDRLQIDKIIPEGQALTIMRAVAEALKYAWNEHRLMHRDLKPGNIMIDFEGHTMLMDFGISKSLDDADSMMTMNNAIVGTPYYMSPGTGSLSQGLRLSSRHLLIWRYSVSFGCRRLAVQW